MAPRIGRTPERDTEFFRQLALHGIVIDACDATAYARTMVYEWRKTDTDFAKRWDDAIESSIQRLEREADRRARDGEPELVLHNGNVVMVDDGKGGKEPLIRRKRSDVLLIFRLKALRPEIYRDRLDMRGEVHVTFGLADRLEAARRRAKGEKPKGK